MQVVYDFDFLIFFNHKNIYFDPPIVLIMYPQIGLKLHSTLMWTVKAFPVTNNSLFL